MTVTQMAQRKHLRSGFCLWCCQFFNFEFITKAWVAAVAITFA